MPFSKVIKISSFRKNRFEIINNHFRANNDAENPQTITTLFSSLYSSLTFSFFYVNIVLYSLVRNTSNNFSFHHSLVQASTVHKTEVGLMECVQSLVMFVFRLFNSIENSVLGISFLLYSSTECNRRT